MILDCLLRADSQTSNYLYKIMCFWGQFEHFRRIADLYGIGNSLEVHYSITAPLVSDSISPKAVSHKAYLKKF